MVKKGLFFLCLIGFLGVLPALSAMMASNFKPGKRDNEYYKRF